MIRFLNVILNEDAIEYIGPDFHHDGLRVLLRSGQEISIADATIEQAHDALAAVGFIAPQPVDATSMPFTEAERSELRAAYLKGLRYVAQDKSGKTFAYGQPPVKGKGSWLNDDDRSCVSMVYGDFSALSFADEYPLDLEVLFGEEGGSC